MNTAITAPLKPDPPVHVPMTFSMALAIAMAAVKGKLSTLPHIERLSPVPVLSLLQHVQDVYHTTGRSEIDPKFGALVALVGAAVLKANPTFIEKELSTDAKLLVDVLNSTVLSELQRILGADTVRSFASSEHDASTMIVGLVYAEPAPTVNGIFSKLKQLYCTTSDATLGAIDARIRAPLAIDNAQNASGSLRRRVALYVQRSMVFGAPIADAEQVLTSVAEMRTTPQYEFFVSFLSTQATARTAPWKPDNLKQLADAFDQFIIADPRTEELMTKLSASGSANIATGSGGGGTRGRSPSRDPSPKRSTTTSSPAAVTKDTTRDDVKRRLNIERYELATTATGKFCGICIADGHNGTMDECRTLQRLAGTPPPDTSKKKDRRRRGSPAGKSP